LLFAGIVRLIVPRLKISADARPMPNSAHPFVSPNSVDLLTISTANRKTASRISGGANQTWSGARAIVRVDSFMMTTKRPPTPVISVTV
jgi:hypothetical protein